MMKMKKKKHLKIELKNHPNRYKKKGKRPSHQACILQKIKSRKQKKM